MEELPLSIILTNVKQSAVRLSKFKHGATTSATEWREELLVALRKVPTWVGTLTHARREEVLPVLINKQTKAFVSGGPGKLRMGKLIQLPPGNATPVLAGMVRKEYGAVLKMLNSTVELAAKWELKDESEGGGEGSPPSDVDEEEADSPPRRRRPPEHSQRPSARRRPSSSPAATGKALSKITKAYHLVMTLARRVQQTPHAFDGGEMEWGVRPATYPTVTQHANDDVPLDTLDDLMDADLPLEALEGYLMYLRGSAIAWHAHLLKMPDFRKGLVVDPRADGWLEWRASERATSHTTNDSVRRRRGVFEKADDVFIGNFTNDIVQHATDGRLSAREPVKYSKAEFAYRLIQFARTMPESMDRDIHFYITYVVDLITQMSKYDVKCVVDYDKLVRQKLATGFLTTWNPDMLHATWMLDLSEHGVSLEALREFESSTVEMGAAIPKVTEFADRWAVVFQDDPAVDDLVRSVSLGAGWKFNPDSVVMSGKNYVKEGFDFKVDKHHQEELTARRVVPVPEGWARAIHGVGIVDKDHSNFEKVRVVHNYSLGERWFFWHFMVKVDIESAYRHFPIALQYLPYHTYRWKAAEAQEALLLLGDVLLFLGLEVAEEKSSLPGEKCVRLRTQVSALAEKGWARRKDLERLMGQLACASRVVRGLSLFCGSCHALFVRACAPSLTLPNEVRSDFRSVDECLRLYNGQQVVLNRREVSSSHFSVDASTGTGMGGFLDGLLWHELDWEGHNAWCNLPFSRILEILQHFLECKRRQNVGMAACFVIPVWPTAGFFKFIEARPTVFFPLVRFDADSDLFTAPAVPGQKTEFRDLEDGLTHYTMNAVAGNTRSTYGTGDKQYCRFAVRADFRPVFPATERTLSLWVTFLARTVKYGCLLAFGACLRKANVTAKKENAFSGTGVMLKTSIRFEGRDKMRVVVSFSKTNQFSERTHKTRIHQ
eukprot:gene6069-biopygen6099